MEQIEDKWREDYNELLTTISRLQDDNRKLTNSLQAAEKDKIVDSKCIAYNINQINIYTY